MTEKFETVSLKDTGIEYDNTGYNKLEIYNTECTHDYIEIDIKGVQLVLDITTSGTISLFTRNGYEFVQGKYKYEFKTIRG